MLKEWTVRCGIAIAVFIFLLNDILNWDSVKSAISGQLEEQGIHVEKIEKISLSQIHLTGVTYASQRFDKIVLHCNVVHLCANGIKWLMNRNDFRQEFTLSHFETRVSDLPILLNHPFTCFATPDNLHHGRIELKVGSGIAVIHDGETDKLNQKIDLYRIPLPDSSGRVSGVIDVSKKAYNIKFLDKGPVEKRSIYLKGIWEENFQTHFVGSCAIGDIKKVDFAGKVIPDFSDLQNSKLDIRGSWKGTFNDLYNAIHSDFKLVRGELSVNWNVTGTVKKPSVSAGGKVAKGTFEVPAIGLYLKDLQATIEGKDLDWFIRDLHAKDTEKKEGVLHGTGFVNLSKLSQSEKNFEYGLNLTLNNIAVLMMENITGVCSGDVQLTGDIEGIALKGDALVHHIELVIDSALSSGKQPLPIVFKDELQLEPKTPYPVLFDINLRLEKPGIVQGQNLRTQWIGEAHLGGSTKELLLSGDLKLLDGEYRLNGKSVDIKEGLIRFEGNIVKDTTVFAIATIELKELIAEIIVRGHLDTLTLTLRSNPPLPQREILSWVLFNQGAKHITALQGEQLNRSLSEFTKGGGTKNVLSDIQGHLGIDRIDLDRRGLGTDEEVSLKLGKYLSKNFFVGVSKGINSDVNRIGFEASLNQHWKVQGEIGDNAEGQMHLKWKNDY